MSPNGLGAQLAALALCVVVALDTALVWHRVRRWWGTLVRSVAVLLCASTALAAAGIWVNREMNLFTQWSEVGGRPPAAPAPGALKVDRVSATGSRIVTFTIFRCLVETERSPYAGSEANTASSSRRAARSVACSSMKCRTFGLIDAGYAITKPTGTEKPMTTAARQREGRSLSTRYWARRPARPAAASA